MAETGRDDLAIVRIADMGGGRLIEFVESLQPPLARDEKWVNIVSTMFGCPVGCLMCDAGGSYGGKLSKEEILAQIDFLVDRRWHGRRVGARKFKIQFARLGEPAMNMPVLDCLEVLPGRYDAPGLIPSISTIAPAGSDEFFERLIGIKRRLYRGGRFQLQFSLHTTDEGARERLIPVKKWGLDDIARYGERFFEAGDRKIALNFALAENASVDCAALRSAFDPAIFMIKLTPINPTHAAARNGLASQIAALASSDTPLASSLRALGFDVIVSLGEAEENLIGSNCGQFLLRHLREEDQIEGGYTYGLADGGL